MKKIKVISRRPIRRLIISNDEIINLKILLNITDSVNSFLFAIEKKTGSPEKIKSLI